MMNLRGFGAGLLILALGGFLITYCCFPQVVKAQEHGEEGVLEHTVSTDGVNGLGLLLANLYNDQRFLYALFVTFMMALLGIIVGQVTDMLLRILGVKRPKRH